MISSSVYCITMIPQLEYKMGSRSVRLLKTQLYQKFVRLLPKRVWNDLQRLLPVGEEEELRRLGGVGGPVNLLAAAVRVECVDEADEEVGHVSAPEDVREFGGVRLACSEHEVELVCWSYSTYCAHARDLVAFAH